MLRKKYFLLLLALSALQGCATPSAGINGPIASNDEQGAYVIGSVGQYKEQGKTAIENVILFFRKRGAESNFYLMSEIGKNSENSVSTELGGGNAFALKLKPGSYEAFSLKYINHEYNMTTTYWSKEEFSVPVELEAGKSYYLGDFRSYCISDERCMFFVSYDNKEDVLSASRKIDPEIPEPTPLDMDFKDALPFIFKLTGTTAPLIDGKGTESE